MRAIKSILYMAGRLKAQAAAEMIRTGLVSTESEDTLLIRAMLDSNLPKFLVEDTLLFNGIVQDLFPSLKISQADHGRLETEIRKALRE